MKITYANKKVEKQCTDLKESRKKFPKKIAQKLHKLVNFIENADNLSEVINFSRYNFHDLKGNHKGLYSLYIDGPRGGYRLIVTFKDLTNEMVFSQSITIQDIKIKEVSKHYE